MEAQNLERWEGEGGAQNVALFPPSLGQYFDLFFLAGGLLVELVVFQAPRP